LCSCLPDPVRIRSEDGTDESNRPFDAEVEPAEEYVEEYADSKYGQLERLPRLFSCGKAPSSPHHVVLVDGRTNEDRREEADRCNRFRTRKKVILKLV
jgi:hypothetical protein